MAIELEQSSQGIPPVDRRPRMPEPPPVQVVAVADVTLLGPVGIERELDRFYVGLLLFERESADQEHLIYRAENCRLRFDLREEPIIRASVRPTRIVVGSLALSQQKLLDAGIEYTYHRTLAPGGESLLMLDPAGNWVELVEHREV